MAQAGIGVDIVDIARMERVLERSPSFLRRVFTEEERAYCESTPRPGAHYACRFAAREAVLKALGTGFSRGIGKADVSVHREPNGHPVAVITGRAAEIAEEMGVVEVAISLSFTSEMAIANAMVITEDARPKPKESKDDERAVIARSFKEARAVLDDLERVQEAVPTPAQEDAAANTAGASDKDTAVRMPAVSGAAAQEVAAASQHTDQPEETQGV